MLSSLSTRWIPNQSSFNITSPHSKYFFYFSLWTRSEHPTAVAQCCSANSLDVWEDDSAVVCTVYQPATIARTVGRCASSDKMSVREERYTGCLQINVQFQKLINLFLPYTGKTYTVSSSNCPSFSCATSSSLARAYCGAVGPVYKMASQQEKAFCVLRFEVCRSVITVQRARFRKDAPCMVRLF